MPIGRNGDETMTNDEIMILSMNMITQYLSAGPQPTRTIENASVSVEPLRNRSVLYPADAVLGRVVVEEPDLGWTIHLDVMWRDGTVRRAAVIGYFSDTEHDDAATRKAVLGGYLEWLRAI